MGEYTAVAVTDVHVNWRAGAMLLQHCHDVPEALTAERAMVGRMGDLLLGIHQRLASSLRQLAVVVGLQSAHELLGVPHSRHFVEQLLLARVAQASLHSSEKDTNQADKVRR